MHAIVFFIQNCAASTMLLLRQSGILRYLENNIFAG